MSTYIQISKSFQFLAAISKQTQLKNFYFQANKKHTHLLCNIKFIQNFLIEPLYRNRKNKSIKISYNLLKFDISAKD